MLPVKEPKIVVIMLETSLWIVDCVASLQMEIVARSVRWRRGELFQKRTVVRKNEASGAKTVSTLSCGKKRHTIREAVSDVTTESKTEVDSLIDKTLSTDKVALQLRLRTIRMSNDAKISGISLPQHGIVESQIPIELRGIPGASSYSGWSVEKEMSRSTQKSTTQCLLG